MRKIVALIILSLILGGCSLPFGKNPKTALDIKSDPVASVYIDNNHVGTTPFYKDDFKPGEYTVKLVVESNPNQTWETKVNLKPQLLTNVTRTFGATDDTSSHFILSLEAIANDQVAEITVVTLPDSAVVKRDGQPTGFAPVQMTALSPGDYQIEISSPGYKPQTIPIKAIGGHRLTISAKLAKDRDMAGTNPTPTPAPASSSAQLTNPSPSPRPSPSPAGRATATSSGTLQKPYITVKPTETGWLRVRSEPSGLADNEVARIDVGKNYRFVQSNNAGWYQIEYAPGKMGWVSAQYATLVQ